MEFSNVYKCMVHKLIIFALFMFAVAWNYVQAMDIIK